MLMTSAETESKNEIKNTRFRTFNVIAIWGHFLIALSMISIYLSCNSLVIPYTESYLQWNNVSSGEKCPLGSREFNTSSSGKFCISATTQPVSCDDDGNCYGIDLGWLIISFHILSFVFQYAAELSDTISPFFGYQYSVMVANNKNPLRFIEYSFSASIMLIAIALLNGVTDINLITSIAVLTSSCQLCGLAVEFVEQRSIKWLLHFTGWLQFCWAYGIIGHAFFKSIESAAENGGRGPPDFVYVIVITLFILFSSFGFVQLCELCIELNPYTKEMSYILLSLTAKLILGLMIFSNVLVLSN